VGVKGKGSKRRWQWRRQGSKSFDSLAATRLKGRGVATGLKCWAHHVERRLHTCACLGVTNACLRHDSMPAGPKNLNQLRVVFSSHHVRHVNHDLHNFYDAHNRHDCLGQGSSNHDNTSEDKNPMSESTTHS
jgi:hypothetical protein